MPQRRSRLRQLFREPPTPEPELGDVTFRSRLRSQGPPPHLTPKLSPPNVISESLEARKIYENFCQLFGLDINDAKDIAEDDGVSLFKEALARVGSDLCISLVDDLVQIYNGTASSIANFSHSTSHTTGQIESFYSSITPPLSVTLVSSDATNNETIEKRLGNLVQLIRNARDGIQVLQQDHASLCCQEEVVWKALSDSAENSSQDNGWSERSDQSSTADFTQQARAIADEQMATILQIERDYKRNMKLVMTEMMEQLMA